MKPMIGVIKEFKGLLVGVDSSKDLLIHDYEFWMFFKLFSIRIKTRLEER